MNGSALQNFLGGSPAAVLVRLAFVSLVVGACMAWLGIDPLDVVDWLHASFLHLYATGFEGLRQVGRYMVMGAMIVVPVWLFLRVFGSGWRRPPAPDPLPGGRWRVPNQADRDIVAGRRP